MEASELQKALVDNLKHAGYITTAQVEAAFRAVPRHLFLPGVAVDEVYRDMAIITKRLNDQPISSSSQPAMMAIMLEQLDLKPGQRVLEIGAGTGYNAALMAYLVGDTGLVVTVDIDQDLVEDARQHLAAAGYDRVQAICGDGGVGYADDAPYDRIILTVGANDILPAWRAQLKPDGRLVLPLSIRLTQKSVAFEQINDYLVSTSIKDCSFMMLRGAFAGPGLSSQLGPEAGLHFTSDHQDGHDIQAIYRRLMSPGQDWPTAVRVTEREVWGGLSMWLDLYEANFCNLWAEGEIAARGAIPTLFTLGDGCSTSGLVDRDGLCLLMRSPEADPEKADETPFELFVRNYAPHDVLAQQLIKRIRAWDTAGRPGTDRLRIRAYPLDVNYRSAANEISVEKNWTRLALDWQR
jgi:protein-L-isoaspartate(D-aspartate) O-methyltransferase